MLRQKRSYRKGIETRKKSKSNEKIELKFAAQQLQAKFPAENANICWLQLKISCLIQKVVLLFWKFLSYDGGYFDPTLHQRLRVKIYLGNSVN